MKIRHIGLYDGRQSEELNGIMKHYYETTNDDNVKQKMNELRKILGIDNYIAVAKHNTEDLYIVRVFDAIADDKTVGHQLRDEISIYFEIED